jgi:ribosomal protein S12 methylthiotransferase accessory factor
MATAGVTTTVGSTQSGEPAITSAEAFDRGMAAAAALSLTPRLTPMLDSSPGTWECVLSRDGVPVPHALGYGTGDRAAARAGAMFEALAHHLGGLVGLDVGDVELHRAHEIANGVLAADMAVSILAEGENHDLACTPYQALPNGPDFAVPVFLSMPDYLDTPADPLRTMVGDHYDYTAAGRYSTNNGWAAGSDPVEATVHALDELVERDAFSLLLIEQFLATSPPPLRLVDPATLPADLADLLAHTSARVGEIVHLIEMTTDLDIPAYLAYLPAAKGQPARVRGAGASLSRHYAIARSITELLQVHSSFTLLPADGALLEPVARRQDATAAYPPLHACYLSDFASRMHDSILVPYRRTATPHTPGAHLERLLAILVAHGMTALARTQYVSENLAVVNVFVPGLERFVIVTDGRLVVPGARGLDRIARDIRRMP